MFDLTEAEEEILEKAEKLLKEKEYDKVTLKIDWLLADKTQFTKEEIMLCDAMYK